MEEEIDPNYIPGDDEVVEYAKWLGMELEKDQDLFWIAREGLMAPLPKNWKPCKTKDTEGLVKNDYISLYLSTSRSLFIFVLLRHLLFQFLNW
jgi:hypothetical protein